MGKYMKKTKISTDVAVMELSQSSVGVRTRAKTLALQRLQATKTPPDSEKSSTYIQLRSRRLEKPSDTLKQKISTPKESCERNPEINVCSENPNHGTSSRLSPVRLDSISCSNSVKGCVGESTVVANKEGAEYCNDLGMEAYFGENNLDYESRERSTRESTPCSLARHAIIIGTPGSSTRPTNLTTSDRISWNSMQQNIPSHEMEEFFSFFEQQQQRRFTDKYNFDFVNDLPFPGRYEWVRM